VSLLTRVFNFLGIATYNATAPTVTAAQASPLQCDQNGRLFVTVAAISSGAGVAMLALPVTTVSRTIATPTITNGYGVSAPFNTAGGGLTQTMPTAPIRGMRVTVSDSGGFATTTPSTLTDSNGYKIQSPMNPASLATSLSFAWSGFAATWEFITGDPTNGSFWMVVRSLQ
jgi:hypothetical protein